jgi:hypothetical protein
MLCLTVRLIYLWYVDVFNTIDLPRSLLFLPPFLSCNTYVVKTFFVYLYKHEVCHHLGVEIETLRVKLHKLRPSF